MPGPYVASQLGALDCMGGWNRRLLNLPVLLLDLHPEIVIPPLGERLLELEVKGLFQGSDW